MTTRAKRNPGFAMYQKVEAVLANEVVYMLDQGAPEPLEGGEELSVENRGGQRSVYPFWVYFVAKTMVHVFGSLRQVERELREGELWDRIRLAAHHHRPEDGPLPELPPSIDQIHTWTTRHFTTQTQEEHERDYSPDPLKARLAALVTRYSVGLALAMGLFAEDRAGSFAHPALEKVIYGDGKVVTPRFRAKAGRRYRDPVTHSLTKVIATPDARLCVTGGGKRVFGTPWVHVVGRGEGWRQRVIFAFAHVAARSSVTDQSGEANVAVDLFKRVLPLLPGCQGVLYDGAFHHTHGRHMFKWVPFTSRLTKAPGGKPNNCFYPYPVEVHLHHPSTVIDQATGEIRPNPEPDPKAVVVINDGSDSGAGAVRVHLVSGRPHTCERTRRGPEHHVAFILESVDRTGSPNYRWYGVYSIPPQPWCPNGGWVRLRLDETAEDRRVGFKRCEYLRAIPGDVDDPDELELRRVYGLRNDAESGNATYDRSLTFYERAHSTGAERQWVDHLTWQVLENSLAQSLWASDWQFEDDASGATPASGQVASAPETPELPEVA